MIDSPVLRLQDSAASVSVHLEELLLRGKMIAWKLDLKQAIEWFENELNGYADSPLPDYRIVHKVPIQGFDTYENRWVRINVANYISITQPQYNQYTTMRFGYSVSRLLRHAAIEKSHLVYFDLPHNMFDELQQNFPNKYTRLCWTVGTAVFSGLLTKIRTKTLDWACLLEKENILGEGLQFTHTEMREAQSVTNNNTINYNGNGMAVLGDIDSKNSVVGGTVSNVNQQNVTGDFSALERQLKEFGYDENDIKQLEKLIAEVPTPTTETEVQKGFLGWIMDKTGKALNGGMNIAGSAATAALTKAISQYFGI